MPLAPRTIIIGGGIGGLSCAIALRKVGIDVTVLEQAPELREAGAGVAIWTSALASLDVLGAGDAVRQSTIPLRTMAGANARGKTLWAVQLDAFGPDFQTAACRIVLRPVLLAALARQVPQECIQTGRRVVRVEQTAQAACVHLADGSTMNADLLVAADGLFSAARAEVVGTDAIRYSGQTCFRGIARMPVSDLDTLREVQGTGQRAAVCPVDTQTAYWWAAINAPADRPLPVEARKAFLLEKFKGWPFAIPEALAATPADAFLQNDLVDRVPVRRYAQGRIVLIGDAAHPTTPNLGQGANMAIDDAIVLARALRAAASLPDALAHFERERLPRTRKIVERSWNYGRVARWTSGPAITLRETLVRLTPRKVMRNMMRWQILESVGDL